MQDGFQLLGHVNFICTHAMQFFTNEEKEKIQQDKNTQANKGMKQNSLNDE